MIKGGVSVVKPIIETYWLSIKSNNRKIQGQNKSELAKMWKKYTEPYPQSSRVSTSIYQGATIRPRPDRPIQT